ncbi:hypothetical protein AYI69_g4480 [Smittium culicis]|uniref:DUF4246 domain-containing protein n=1 Tax=Smittium culicis TaxID=133412 RepID=A0A1R1YDK2_9FUNG|nr:hypothetical protein AYI69_g4480 [Smittium culicis]
MLSGPVDRAFISDAAIPLQLTETLICLASKLEADIKKNLNKYPNPNNQNLDLFYPSLYLVVFCETRAISKDLEPDQVVDWKSIIETGDISNVIPSSLNNLTSATRSSNLVTNSYYSSSKYQRPPTEFEIDSLIIQRFFHTSTTSILIPTKNIITPVKK